MDNTKVFEYVEQRYQQDAKFQAMLAAYQQLTDEQRAELDAIILTVADKNNFRIGIAGTFELLGKLGMWLEEGCHD